MFSTNELKVFSSQSKSKTLYYGPLSSDAYKHLLIFGNRLSPSATIVNRSFIDINNISFNVGHHFIAVEDYDFWLTLALNGANFLFVQNIQGEYLVHASNNSGRENLQTENELKLLHHHVFNVQNFTLNKGLLWRRINCRLSIHSAFYSLRKKQIKKFILKLLLTFFWNPVFSFLYFSERLAAKCTNYFKAIQFYMNKNNIQK